MKKYILAPLMVLTIFTIFGCSKQRTCTETTTHTNGNVDTNVTNYTKLTPKERKDIENYGTSTDGDGTVYKTICK